MFQTTSLAHPQSVDGGGVDQPSCTLTLRKINTPLKISEGETTFPSKSLPYDCVVNEPEPGNDRVLGQGGPFSRRARLFAVLEHRLSRLRGLLLLPDRCFPRSPLKYDSA